MSVVTSYTTYVINNASTTYAQAYFEINYINVYSSNPSTFTTISPSGPTPTSSTSTSTSTSASVSKSMTMTISKGLTGWKTPDAGTLSGGARRVERESVLVAMGLLVSFFYFGSILFGGE